MKIKLISNQKYKKLDKNLEKRILNILYYFDKGLSDIEAGSEEKQPMHLKIKNAIKDLKKLESIIK